MVPQHGHDLQLIVSQQQTDLMDTTVGGVQQIQQQQQQISNMNHALQQQNMLESVLQQSQVVVNNEQQQMMQQQQQISPVLFGSQMVDKNSSTPYTDATQVKPDLHNFQKKKIPSESNQWKQQNRRYY